MSDRSPRRGASSLVTAETIAVGSELLVGGRTDGNSVFIAEALGRLGIELRFKSVVGDDEADIMAVVRTAVRRAGVVIMTGGLGPTVDDCTRAALARVTGKRLAIRKEALEGMAARLAQWGRTPNAGQRRQALIPSGANVIANPVGSAPGFWLTWKGSLIFSLPGVPHEMQAMVTASVIPLLETTLEDRRVARVPLTRLVFHTFGLAEADVDAKLSGIVPRGINVDLGLLASPLGVLVSLTMKPGRVIGDDVMRALAAEVRSRLSGWLFAEGHDTMEEVVGRLLTDKKLTLALAESCTGGLIGHRLTQVPGSSSYVDRGIVCYSNQAKIDLLGVEPRLIERHGAVSAEVAEAMAKGARERSGTSVGLSVTGIAGPGGATATKPVGLVYIGLSAAGGETLTKEYRFHGERTVIKQRASQAALDLLRRWALTQNPTAGGRSEA
ncbi:MAG TPA: competence/damage-inducible protein A [Nitrospira sp.]|nr:competence/damage-inducible protein A [Nitrospira sp.]